ncbi:MAG: DUF4197 family protein, partial [Saprospiraceae bacterium]|nr:DUF4197 family protein [Saprospiraceae bacterium]
MKKLILSFLVIITMTSSCKVLEELALVPSEFETISALKEVLNSSAFRSIATLKKMNDGGVEALLPQELQPVFGTLRNIGLGGKIDEVNKQIVSVSGVVVEESGYIMADAIKELTFTDAVAVVTGGKDAATQVLREKMYISVKKRYSGRLDEELQKGGGDAVKYWPIATNAYNLFSKDKVEGTLSDFIA